MDAALERMGRELRMRDLEQAIDLLDVELRDLQADRDDLQRRLDELVGAPRGEGEPS